MPDTQTFEFVVRTPHEVVLQAAVRSVRVVTETGYVGLRPRSEQMVLAVEAGIVNVQSVAEKATREQFVGTAGGLLICNNQNTTLLTPLAVTGDNEQAIAAELQHVLQQPNQEMDARTMLSKLEGHILSELRREQTAESHRTPGTMV